MNKDELFDGYINDSLNEDGLQELEELLKDEKIADELAEYILETGMMVNAAENVEAKLSPAPNNNPLYTLIAIAAVLLISASLFWLNQPSGSYTVVTSSLDNFKKGQAVEKTLKLDSGRLTIESPHGDIIKLKAPLKASLLSPSTIHLDSGSAQIHLAAGRNEFTVTTPFGRIKDLGTVFAVLSGKSSSEVHVYEGKVELSTEGKQQKIDAHMSRSLTQSGEILEIPFIEDALNKKFVDKVFLGTKSILPGEQVELYLDKAGKVIAGKAYLEFDEQKDFKYRVNAYSKGELIYQTNVLNAEDELELNIPTAKKREISIELKVVNGIARNAKLKFNSLVLETDGHRPYEGELLIASGSVWKYWFKNWPDNGWIKESFDDSHWKSAPATLGYGDDDLKTKIGDKSLRKTVAQVFIRKNFEINDLEIEPLKKLKVSLLADDGAQIFLNGVEVIRYNIPNGKVTDKTRALKTATANSGEMIYNNFSITPSLLKPGQNQLSVLLIQRGGKSSDMRFDLQMTAY